MFKTLGPYKQVEPICYSLTNPQGANLGCCCYRMTGTGWVLLMWHHTHVGDLIKFRSEDHMCHVEPAEAQAECLVTTPEWNSIYPKLPSATKTMDNCWVQKDGSTRYACAVVCRILTRRYISRVNELKESNLLASSSSKNFFKLSLSQKGHRVYSIYTGVSTLSHSLLFKRILNFDTLLLLPSSVVSQSVAQ